MDAHFSFISYNWNLGTTSFRMKNFHRKIEEQLSLLDSFWKASNNMLLKWNPETQRKYYNFLYNNNFLNGNIQNDPDKQSKTARQKTSGLIELGLIEENRRLTPVGQKLLEIVKSKNFTSDNDFKIPKDSFIYFKQLLKTTIKIGNNFIRPYLVIGYLLTSCNGYLSKEEFTFLAPLCVNSTTLKIIINDIKKLRANELDIDTIISDVVIKNDSYNYQKALHYFLTNPATSENIQIIGMNRDGINKDKPYVKLFNILKNIYLDGDNQDKNISALYEATKSLAGKVRTYWRKILFQKNHPHYFQDLKKNSFDKVVTIENFKKVFFFYLHISKIRATLSDYYDLNRRYLKITDSILFENEKVKYTALFNSFFHTNAKRVFEKAFEECTLLKKTCKLTDIDASLIFDPNQVISSFRTLYGIKQEISDISSLNHYLESRNRKLFISFIDKEFPNTEILRMLDWFEKRTDAHDKELMQKVDGEADVPTIFEYIIGILWFRLSNYEGDIFNYLKLSIGADMLPRQHAAGGKSDIVYQYSKSSSYPKHTLLIECTLMQGTNQRNGEMEPVSRHLLDYMLKYNMNTYCVFVANILNYSTISDFRMRAFYPSYRNDGKFVKHMKIIPLDIEDLKKILNSQKQYPILYKIFDKAYNDKNYLENPIKWREACVSAKL